MSNLQSQISNLQSQISSPIAAIDAAFAQPVQLANAIDNRPADPQFARQVREQQAGADGEPSAIAKSLEKLAEQIADVRAELMRQTDPINRTARATQALAEAVSDV